MHRWNRISWVLTVAASFALAACGGGGGGAEDPVPPPPAPSALIYASPQSFTVGSAIAPLTPTVMASGPIQRCARPPRRTGTRHHEWPDYRHAYDCGDHDELSCDRQQQRRLGDVRPVPLSAPSTFVGAAFLDDDRHGPGHPGFCDTQEQYGGSVSQLSGCGPDHLVFRAAGNCVGGCQWCHHRDGAGSTIVTAQYQALQRSWKLDVAGARRAGC